MLRLLGVENFITAQNFVPGSLNTPGTEPGDGVCGNLPGVTDKTRQGFAAILAGASRPGFHKTPEIAPPANPVVLPAFSLRQPTHAVSRLEAVAAYQQQANQCENTGQMRDLEKYRDDQLLSNPGGDHYYLGEKKVVSHPKDQESFWGRIAKDISDAFDNVKNFFQDLWGGAKTYYRDQNNQIQETTRRGLIGSVIDFFKDMGSALTFGMWRPDGEPAPQGVGERLVFSVSKLKEAIFGDLIQGVTGSVNHMAEDLVLAGWNLVEVIPDATIGNFEAGRKLTTTIFDNGQVIIDYLTDVLPSGEAWLRVHSPNFKEKGAPLLYNLSLPEHYKGDTRWQYIRNTPFRKTIETIGSLLADIVTLDIVGKIEVLSEEPRRRH